MTSDHSCASTRLAIRPPAGVPFNTFLEGDMDEVRLSDVARTADEIAAAYEGCE